MLVSRIYLPYERCEQSYYSRWLLLPCFFLVWPNKNYLEMYAARSLYVHYYIHLLLLCIYVHATFKWARRRRRRKKYCEKYFSTKFVRRRCCYMRFSSNKMSCDRFSIRFVCSPSKFKCEGFCGNFDAHFDRVLFSCASAFAQKLTHDLSDETAVELQSTPFVSPLSTNRIFLYSSSCLFVLMPLCFICAKHCWRMNKKRGEEEEKTTEKNTTYYAERAK